MQLKTHVVAIAPNKVIITGEHAVVYGSPAISTGISTKNEVELFTAKGTASLFIHFGRKVYAFDSELKPLYKEKHAWMHEYGVFIQEILDFHKIKFADLNIKLDLHLRPSGSPKGTGGSAAWAAATVCAIHSLFDYIPSKSQLFDETQLQEKKAHGNPSGIDAMSVISSNSIVFQKHFNPVRFDFNEVKLTLPRGTSLLIIDTTQRGKVTEQTNELVDRFAKAFFGKPPAEATDEDKASVRKVFDPVVNAIQKELHANGSAKRLGDLFNENHTLLRKYDVSCPNTERIVELALAAGVLGVKITGAGGQNGCCIALVEDSKIKEVTRKLKENKIKTLAVNFPAKGAHTELVE